MYLKKLSWIRNTRQEKKLFAKDLQTSIADVQLSLASFFVGLSLGQLFSGPITDRFGRKKPLYVGLGLYMLASLACVFAPNVETLIALRFV